jgi:hypothetical protein
MNRPRLGLPLARTPAHAALVAALALGAAAVAQAPRVASAQGAPVAQSADTAARARDLFKKGRQEFDQGHMGAAYESYLGAWELQKSYDIAGNLASLEMETARYRGAAEHAAYALANLPTSSTPAQREFLQKVLADAKKQIVTVTIRVNVDRAAVTVDGHSIGESPLKGEVYVDAGDHVIAATAPDYPPAQEKLHAGKGGASLIMLNLVKGGTGPGGGPLLPPVTPRAGVSPIVVAGFVTAGVAAGAGAAFAILSKVKADGAGSKLDALTHAGVGPSGCAGPSPSADCVALHDTRAARDTFASAALWTFVAAGAVTAGTLVYSFAIPHGTTGAPKATGVQVTPVVSPGAGALLVTGAF